MQWCSSMWSSSVTHDVSWALQAKGSIDSDMICSQAEFFLGISIRNVFFHGYDCIFIDCKKSFTSDVSHLVEQGSKPTPRSKFIILDYSYIQYKLQSKIHSTRIKPESKKILMARDHHQSLIFSTYARLIKIKKLITIIAIKLNNSSKIFSTYFNLEPRLL